jgi:hypothetical protein
VWRSKPFKDSNTYVIPDIHVMISFLVTRSNNLHFEADINFFSFCEVRMITDEFFDLFLAC